VIQFEVEVIHRWRCKNCSGLNPYPTENQLLSNFLAREGSNARELHHELRNARRAASQGGGGQSRCSHCGNERFK